MSAAAASKPVFIGGPDRCGKTSLAAILGSHPDLAIPIVGSNMWTFFYEQCGDLRDDAALDRCIDRMLRYKHVAFLEPDEARLRADMASGPRTYAHLFALFQEQFAARAGKPRWGDQTGLIERYADEVLGAYPDARMIHMVRDPRDRYEASLAAWPDGSGRAGGATARWRYSMALAARNARSHRDRYRLLRYEDLVADPGGTIREICEFVELSFDPGMLRMGDAPTFVRKLAGSTPVPDDPATLITDEYVGRYQGVLRAQDTAFIELFAGHRMKALGYDLDHPRMSARELVRFFLVDVPFDLVRFGGWLGLELAQHRLPNLIGRSPVAAKVGPA